MPRKKSEQDIEFDVRVGARIEAARLHRRVTQRAMAKKLSISVNQYYWYETGRSSCPLTMIVKIASVLGISWTQLVPEHQVDVGVS